MTRERMATLSADDVTADEIERTDTVLAGLAYQYATGAASHVAIFVSDRIAEQAVEDVLAAVDNSDTTAVIEGRAFLEKLVADQFG